MANSYKLEIDQGTDVSFPVVLKDSSGTVIDLTGYTARMQIRPFIASSTIIDELTTGNGRAVITAAEGKVAFTFPHDKTAAYPAGNARYDIEIESADGEVTRVLEGAFVVRPEVTR